MTSIPPGLAWLSPLIEHLKSMWGLAHDAHLVEWFVGIAVRLREAGWRDKDTKRYFNAFVEQEKGRASDGLYDALRKRYHQFGPLLMQINQSWFPLLVIPLGGRKPDDILGEFDHAYVHFPSITTEQEDYAAFREAAVPNFVDRDSYVLKKIEWDYASGIPKLHCLLGKYRDAIATCDYMEWELLDAAGRDLNLLNDRVWSRRCPVRCQVEREALSVGSHAVWTGTGRSAAIGVSVLIIFRDEENWRALILNRTTTVANHPHLLHVMPSAMFQPLTRDVKAEFRISETIAREYLEELFSKEEPADPTASGNYPLHDGNYQYLNSLIEKGKAKLELSGLTVNLLNYRPEVCCLLTIDDPTWWKAHKVDPSLVSEFSLDKFKINMAEFRGFHKARDEEKQRWLVRLDDKARLAELRRKPGLWVPPGAAAFWLGVERWRESHT